MTGVYEQRGMRESGEKPQPEPIFSVKSPSAQSPAADLLREATRLHVAGRLAEALPFYQDSLKHSRTPVALNNCGAALRDLKRSAEAIPLFREATELDVDYADARLNLGLSLHDVGDLEAAEPVLKRGRWTCSRSPPRAAL